MSKNSRAKIALAVLLPVALLLGGRAAGQWRDYEKAQALFVQSDRLLEQGLMREAIPGLERSIALCPDMLPSWEALSFCYAEIGRSDKALEVMDASIARFPASPLFYGRKGTLLRALKRYPEASECFATAFRLEPDNFLYQRLQRDCDEKSRRGKP